VLIGGAPGADRNLKRTALGRTRAALLVVASLAGAPTPANAGETTLAEPVIEENITDIDSRHPQSLEFDFTPGVFRSTETGKGFWHVGLELEWRPFDRLGVGAELEPVGALDGAKPVGAVHFVPRGALSYVLLRDFEDQVFVQAEIGAHYESGLSLALVDPTDFAQPYWAGLREGMKFGPVDCRAAAFAQGGGTTAHAPIRGSGAALYSIIGTEVRAALGAEFIADWSNPSPFVAAPEAQILAPVLGRPVRFEIAVPLTVGASEADRGYGISVRIVLEPED
jgi:hypothetical protein